jgi:hypothetical protein
VFKRFLARFRQPQPALRLTEAQIADLKSLRSHDGYRAWCDLLEEEIARECATAMAADDPLTAFAASQRLRAYGRMYRLLDVTIPLQEALNDLEQQRRNGDAARKQPADSRAAHWGSPFFR